MCVRNIVFVNIWLLYSEDNRRMIHVHLEEDINKGDSINAIALVNFLKDVVLKDRHGRFFRVCG